ncbi:PREDICTED: rhodopsin, GQ-coupled-like [Branchiostoma belcheri]|uniref:Rhodopsin, GQ-coupled-like n=1 Tax=Branchiostoma belcheri TaxID=7741 RepID=A0A6P4YD04_BRABE|nr:PREDICTED: rhodopsin, GQ-coupled-like [Branchiostoma belcheri]
MEMDLRMYSTNVRMGLAMLVGCLGIFGTATNLLLLWVLYRRKDIRTSATVYVVNLTAVDLLVTTVVDTLHVLGIAWPEFYRPDAQNSNSTVCDITGSLCVAGCVISLAITAVISVNRYLFICKRQTHDDVFTKRGAAVIVVGMWTYGLGFVLPLWFGWGSFRYDHKTMNCAYDRTKTSYTLVFLLVGHLLPTLTVFAFNTALYLNVVKIKNNLRRYLQDRTPPQARQGTKALRSLSVLCIYFVVCWLQYAVIVLADYDDRWPGGVHFSSLVIAHSSSSMNGVIYALTDRKVREQICRTFRKIREAGPTAFSMRKGPTSTRNVYVG